MTTTSPRVYVASLADYVAGVHHGEWFDVSDADTLRADIAAMLAESPTAKAEGREAEEYAIHDYEGFGSIKLSEFADLDELCQLAEGIEQHGEAYLAWAANDSDNREVSDFEDAYRGRYDSLADYVQEFWEECGDLPKAPKGSWWHPANYTDWDKMAHDLELSGDIWTADAEDGGVHVFDNR